MGRVELVDVEINGELCIVLDKEWEHSIYAERDLNMLEKGN